MFLPTKVYRLPLELATRRLRFRRLFLCLFRGFDELCQYFFQLGSFIVIIAHDDVLRNILVGVEFIRIADIDLHRIRQKVERQPLDLLGPRGRKEQSLPLRGVRYIVHDGSNLRFEAHVKHSVCFIQHHEFDSREISFSHFDEVVDSTGGSDDAFYSTFESCDLRVLGGSPVTTDAANAVGSSKLLCLVQNLTGKFACWGENEHHGPSLSMYRFVFLTFIVLMERWKEKSTCLSGTRFGN
mmetsp:Transcript_18483/g.34248  ORF Transcript_18483/g.34248 Transcript_18483/m.34248 type:complete len:240 (-) Transcript_18483:680-1399(-)